MDRDGDTKSDICPLCSKIKPTTHTYRIPKKSQDEKFNDYINYGNSKRNTKGSLVCINEENGIHDKLRPRTNR
jgi:hypothetical protein